MKLANANQLGSVEVYIVSGRVRFTVGGESAEMGPGDVLLVPPNVVHFAETIGDEPAVDLSIFTSLP
jgi:quercetin dioxygenase-like cupin family protein